MISYRCTPHVYEPLISHSYYIVFVQVYKFIYVYNQKIIDPCGTYIQSQVNTGKNIGINIGIIYN